MDSRAPHNTHIHTWQAWLRSMAGGLRHRLGYWIFVISANGSFGATKWVARCGWGIAGGSKEGSGGAST